MNTNMDNRQMVTLLTHARTSRNRTDPRQDRTEMIVAISKITEGARNRWPLANLHPDNELRLLADIAGDGR